LSRKTFAQKDMHVYYAAEQILLCHSTWCLKLFLAHYICSAWLRPILQLSAQPQQIGIL
jgi:hypothetical protein